MFDLQKRGIRRRARMRTIPRAAEPLFSALLVVISLFMSVLLFGAGSFLGGVLFGSILIPVAYIFWPEADGTRPASD